MDTVSFAILELTFQIIGGDEFFCKAFHSQHRFKFREIRPLPELTRAQLITRKLRFNGQRNKKVAARAVRVQ